MPIGRGKNIVWTEKDIDALAVISDADKERAAVMWRTHAPEEAKDILDAQPVD